MDSMASLLGVAICAVVFLQFAAWTTMTIRRIGLDRRQYELQQSLLRRRLELSSEPTVNPQAPAWNGFRRFIVHRRTEEATDCVSLTLVPEDGRPLPFFQPGQHLTIRLAIPGRSQPVIRCYSLSDAARTDHYRITVRAIGPTVENPSTPLGTASQFVFRQLRAGDRIEAKAPAGSFYLDLNDRRPTVLLAGGIGITPFMSMLNTLVQQRISREVLLVYGVQDGHRHPFKRHLAEIAQHSSLIDVVTCYSRPLPIDRIGVDYQVAGRVSMETIRQLVPSNNIPFYLCGPPTFMRDLFADLRAWGVPESCIQFEAFGPASIRQVKPTEPPSSGPPKSTLGTVVFQKSAKSVHVQADGPSILELAERADVEIPSGCRAGNCGTCQTRLISGQTAYLDDSGHAECDPGHILPCIARPKGDVVVDA
jgi:ferredoxin-NADP reductase